MEICYRFHALLTHKNQIFSKNSLNFLQKAKSLSCTQGLSNLFGAKTVLDSEKAYFFIFQFWKPRSDLKRIPSEHFHIFSVYDNLKTNHDE